MGKTVAFRGIEKGDFPYYVAKSLSSNNFTVAVVDNSYSKDLFEAVHQYEKDNALYVEKENIVYLKDASIDHAFIEKFDYVIFYMGLNDHTFPVELTFIITDFMQNSIQEIFSWDEDIHYDAYYIFRNKITGKISEKSIASEFKIDNESILGTLPFELSDEIAALTLSYGGRFRIKELSNDMQYAIITVLTLITEADEKTVKGYYKKAKRAKLM